MRRFLTRDDHPAKQLMRRIDHMAGELNVFLLVIAIGLAVLDVSALWLLKVENALPTITNVDCPWNGAAGGDAGPAHHPAPQPAK